MMHDQREQRTVPGVMATLATGFDLTAKHLWLLLLPALLDIFYWLGPRLSFGTLMREAVALLPQDANLPDITTQLLEIAPRTNLFTTLTVQLMGVPALMAGTAPEQTPLAPQTLELGSWGAFLGLFVVFTLLGLLLTAVYYTLIAATVARQGTQSALPGLSTWARHVGRSWLRFIGLGLLVLINLLMIYIPITLLAAILSLFSPLLATFILLAGPFLAVWVIIFLSLAPAGIVLNGRPVLRAFMESFRLVQTNLAPALTLLLIIFITNALLDWLLVMADTGTWLTLANIVGHAFVSTALVAALFVFYRDRYRLAVARAAERIQA